LIHDFNSLNCWDGESFPKYPYSSTIFSLLEGISKRRRWYVLVGLWSLK